jgi:prepilin-type N-terminal cleavage/methylation domain-containing protein
MPVGNQEQNNLMHRSPIRRTRAFTLLEVLLASSIFSIMTAALFALSISLQKTFRACSTQLHSQGEQLRILDHIALDLRRAIDVEAQPSRLVVKIPDYYDASGKPNDPVIRNGRVEYGSASAVSVSYYKQGPAVFREVAGKREQIGSDVETFNLTVADLGQTVNVTLSFLPRFQFSSSPHGYREGTATHITTLLRNRRH